jgi:hypothetical protein
MKCVGAFGEWAGLCPGINTAYITSEIVFL